MINLKCYGFISLILFLIGCTHTNKVNNKLVCYRLKFNMPFVRDSGILMNITDSVEILYYNKYRIARTTVKSMLLNNKDSVYETLKYNYFIFKKTESTGYLFRDLYDKNPKIENVDSLFKKQYFTGSVLKPSSNDSLIDTKEINDMLSMKFFSKKHFDESYPDTTIYLFKKDKNNIDFSISKPIDTLTNLKLSKIRCIYNEEKSKNYSFILPARELYLELFEFKLQNENEIIDFIDRFAKEHS